MLLTRGTEAIESFRRDRSVFVDEANCTAALQQVHDLAVDGLASEPGHRIDRDDLRVGEKSSENTSPDLLRAIHIAPNAHILALDKAGSGRPRVPTPQGAHL